MMENTKQQVREFYDQIGWSQVGEGLYQNARYEDLRSVSRDYIHRCHLRVNRYIAPRGDLLLDAGSGPVQWPEYLTYSEGYRFRVCLDLSITALIEARARLAAKGLYVVADIANLPFKSDAFDGIVSMHTIHHLPLSDHRRAYLELQRVLRPDRSAAIVNGWDHPALMLLTRPLVRLVRFIRGGSFGKPKKNWGAEEEQEGTFVKRLTPRWLKQELHDLDFEIFAWRSLSTVFLKTVVNPRWGGRTFLRLVFWLEDRFPRFLGENGQYPLIVIRKPEAA
ncbi:MAG TPA: methyltransferase domain-containing protein [Anaerolineales bacterium]|nr:methyltransferase domain-containing protein [Anaerolineales bacterium]